MVNVMRAGPHELRFGQRTLIMGILNMTPDSFSGDGFDGRMASAVVHARAMAEQGADIIDVGGESTRPGATPVSVAEETSRVVPVIAELAARLDVPISVDTRKAAVAASALQAGASMVNDIWGLRADPVMAAVVARHQPAGLVVMHNRRGTEYRDLMSDIVEGLRESLRIARQAGIPMGQVVVDPGFGFGKTPAQNLHIIRELGRLRELDRPILIGVSNKSTLGLLAGAGRTGNPWPLTAEFSTPSPAAAAPATPESGGAAPVGDHVSTDGQAAIAHAPIRDRLEASLAAGVLAVAHGADVLRVHDVGATARALAAADPIVRPMPDRLRGLRSPGHTL